MLLNANEKTSNSECPSSSHFLVSFYLKPDSSIKRKSFPPIHSLRATSAHQRPQRFSKLSHDLLYNWTLYNNTFHCTMLYEDLNNIRDFIKEVNPSCVHEIIFDSNKRAKGQFIEVHYDNHSSCPSVEKDFISSRVTSILEDSPNAFKPPPFKGANRGTSYVMTKGACTQSAAQVFDNTTHCSLPECAPAVNDSVEWNDTSSLPLCEAVLAVVCRLSSSSFDDPFPFAIKRPENFSDQLWYFYLQERLQTRVLIYKSLLGPVIWDSIPSEDFKALCNVISKFAGCEVNLSTVGTAIKSLAKYLPENIALRWITNVKGHFDNLNCNFVPKTIGYMYKFCPLYLKNDYLKDAMTKDSDLVEEIPISLADVTLKSKIQFQYILLALYSRKCVHDHSLRIAKRKVLRYSNNIDIGVKFVYDFLHFFNKSEIDYNVIVRGEKSLNDIREKNLCIPEPIDPMVRYNSIHCMFLIS